VHDLVQDRARAVLGDQRPVRVQELAQKVSGQDLSGFFASEVP